MVELDGLTDDQLLALGYLIEDGKAEASEWREAIRLRIGKSMRPAF
jgi:hypothetical protein